MNQHTFKQDVHNKWLSDWQFFTTDVLMKVSDLSQPFNGLKLPVTVINKLYRKNAEEIFTRAWK